MIHDTVLGYAGKCKNSFNNALLLIFPANLENLESTYHGYYEFLNDSIVKSSKIVKKSWL